MLHYHDGLTDFPHGAGASLPGWYVYEQEDMLDEPTGPFATELEAFTWAHEHLSY